MTVLAPTVFDRRVAQLGLETVVNTGVPATYQMSALTYTPADTVKSKPLRGAGKQVDATTITQQIKSDFTIAGMPTFSELIWPLLMCINNPSGSTSLGSGAFEWVFTGLESGYEQISTFTLEVGTDVLAEQYVSIFGKSFKLSGTQDGWTFAGTALSKGAVLAHNLTGTAEVQRVHAGSTHPTGGYYILTIPRVDGFGPITTGHIAWNANPSVDVKAAIDNAIAAATPPSTTTVTVAGAPLTSDNAVYDITFDVGWYYGKDVPLLTMDKTNLTTGGTVVITQTTSGGVLPSVVQVPLLATDTELYIDPSDGDIGTTNMPDTFAIDIDFQNLALEYQTMHKLNGVTVAGFTRPATARTNTITITVEDDVLGQTIRSAVLAGETKLLRLAITSDLLIPGSGTPWSFIFDAYVKFHDIKGPADNQNITTRSYTAEILTASPLGYPFQITLDNDMDFTNL